MSIDGGKAPLYGSLRTPEDDSNGAAVLLIAGSGPTDRDGNSTIPGVRPATLKLLAEALAARGTTSLRYDKRGIGRSTVAGAAEADLRFDHFTADATAWAAFLRARTGVRCLFIAGHSEGALIATIAAQAVKPCGLILLAGTGRPLDTVVMEQLRGQNVPATTLNQVATIFATLREGRTVPGIPATDPLFRPGVQPYLISQLQKDPLAELRAVSVPTLIVQGENDLQVTVEDAGLLAGAKPDATLLIVPRMNHVMKEAPADRNGNLATYANPEVPLAEPLLTAITTFIATHSR